MIRYDEQDRIFYLNTNKTSYVFGLRDSNNIPLHLYWGKRLNGDINKEILQKARDEYIFEPPFEYSSYGNPDYRYPSFELVYSSGSTISKPSYNGFEIVKGKPGLK